MIKNKSMGPEVIRSNIKVGVNVVFEEILTLRRVKHTISSKRVIAQTKM